jgi:hypothetical protein
MNQAFNFHVSENQPITKTIPDDFWKNMGSRSTKLEDILQNWEHTMDKKLSIMGLCCLAKVGETQNSLHRTKNLQFI